MKKYIFILLCLFTLQSFAKENYGLNSLVNNQSSSDVNNLRAAASGCAPATSQTDLDVNNIRTAILAGGDMWWDLNDARYEIPKGGGKHSMFAGALWIGGVSDGGQLKVAAMTYRQDGNDFWPGPIDDLTATTTDEECTIWDQHFKITREEVDNFVSYISDPSSMPGYTIPQSIREWPAKGNVQGVVPLSQYEGVAPFYDVNGDGIYNPEDGDYPDYNITGQNDNASLFGDQTLFWVFNDKGNVHTETGGDAIGLEIHAQAFGFATDDEINDMTFYAYKIINKATTNLNETYFGQWVDPDLGYYLDDYVGCDVSRGLGYCYNGDAEDEGVSGYGFNPPAIGVDFFEGPLADLGDGVDNDRDCIVDEDGELIIMSKFVYYNNDFTVTGNPEGAEDVYNYLRAIWKDGVPFTYGGNGKEGTEVCDFMFPGDSDPNGWGIGGDCGNVLSRPTWSEETAGNIPADRRFLQSAGPFTLSPGAVNDITVGVIWARASSGGPMASVNLVRVFDDKAQALFNNNFKVVDGPDAPTIDIVELDQQLVITLSNSITSNNYQEGYKEKDPYISNSSDTNYVFEGYKVFQLKDNTVTVNDLNNPDKARMIFQCDIENDVSQIVNHYFDLSLDAWLPVEEVNGNNQGIRHTFSVTEDEFATGNKTLVNHKTYYFLALAYGFNGAEINANPYNPLDGQNQPYKQGRKNIFSYSAIPHNNSPENFGTILNSQYGDGVEITRIEGTGNGGFSLKINQATEDEILLLGSSDNPTYMPNNGPIDIKVYDPANVTSGTFTLKFDGVQDTARWSLYDDNGQFVVNSAQTIQVGNEQLLPSLGISINVAQVSSPKYINPASGSLDLYVTGSGVDALTKECGVIESSIEFDDVYQSWLTGVADGDGVDSDWATNWIRSGDFEYDFGSQDPDARTDFNDYSYGSYESDLTECFEQILGGSVAPYKFTSYFHDGPAVSAAVHNYVDLNNLQSVKLVFTANKELWTRCIVLESQDEPSQAYGYDPTGAFDSHCKMYPRRSPSVNKDGVPDGTGSGMGWFPGYAINLETGERVNIMFAEDSWLTQENGRDMIWNPTSNIETDVSPSYQFTTDHEFSGGTYLLGGKHFVYIMSSKYDSCNSYMSSTRFGSAQVANGQFNTGAMIQVFREAMWVHFPLLNPNFELTSIEEGLIPTKTTVYLNVKKPYKKYICDDCDVVNDENPMYVFSTDNVATTVQSKDAQVEAIDLINVVPNPYYAYSDYENNQLDNRIKITNLPQSCDIKIYTLSGSLVKEFYKDDPTVTSLDWDLKNNYGIPIASGLYIIHINVKDQNGNIVGERVLKWFGVMRPIDLDTF